MTQQTVWFSTSVLLLIMAILLGCRDPSPSRPQSIDQPSNSTVGDLPAWLQTRPDGWSDDNWHEYQTSLIDLRDPILRYDNYAADELATATAEVEHFPGDYEDHILQEWQDKWAGSLISYERTGGCGCCNEVYTVTGPKAAIEEFPVHRGRREYFPRYQDVKPSG